MKLTKKQVRDNVFKFLRSFEDKEQKGKIKEKFSNICGKTGQYNVPSELFLQRTSRKCRVLISWKVVKENNLTIEQLSSFLGGVVVEFVNEDYFDEENQKDPLFIELKKRLGSDEIVSSMISIRTEDKGSSSQKSRESFKKLIKEFPDYKTKIIRRKNKVYKQVNEGNEKWEGFIYVSIRGGQQDVIETHFIENKTEKKKYYLFNPACEFANETTCLDIDLVMSYFALISLNQDKLNKNEIKIYEELKSYVEFYLKKTEYDNEHFKGNLLDYCKNHPCLKMVPDKLFDPIQVLEITINDFAIDDMKKALDDFRKMINDEKTLENEINKFLLENVWIISFDYANLSTEKKDNYDLHLADKKWNVGRDIVIELKRANKKIENKYGKHEVISSNVGKAISQCINYMEEEKEIFERGIVILGRAPTNAIKKMDKYLHNIELLTYDMIYQKARRVLDFLGGKYMVRSDKK